MPPGKELSYAEVASRTSRSALRVPHRGSSARLPIDPDTGEDLPRTFLPHAIEFDFSDFEHPEHYLPELHRFYGDRVLSIRQLPKGRVQLGFAPGADLTAVRREGFRLAHSVVPMRRVFTPSALIMCITVTNLAVNGEESTASALHAHFRRYGQIADIRLHYLGKTGWQVPSAAVYLDISADPDVADKINRTPVILGQQALLRWRNADSLCQYCKLAGHTAKHCPALERKKARGQTAAGPSSTLAPRKRSRRGGPVAMDVEPAETSSSGKTGENFAGSNPAYQTPTAQPAAALTPRASGPASAPTAPAAGATTPTPAFPTRDTPRPRRTEQGAFGTPCPNPFTNSSASPSPTVDAKERLLSWDEPADVASCSGPT